MQCERSPRTFWPTLVYMCIWETKKMGICGAKTKNKNPSDVTLPSLQDGTARCEQLLQRRFLSGWETPLEPGSHDLTAVRGDEAAPRCHRTVHHLIHATVALRTLSFYFTSSTLARWVRPHCCLQKNYSLFLLLLSFLVFLGVQTPEGCFSVCDSRMLSDDARSILWETAFRNSVGERSWDFSLCVLFLTRSAVPLCFVLYWLCLVVFKLWFLR